MSTDDDFEPSQAHPEFVPAVFARNLEDAERYREVLEDHDIPAVVGDPEDAESAPRRGRSGMTHGVAILVPDALLDEASEIIADREESLEEMDEDYDDEAEEEDELDFDFHEDAQEGLGDSAGGDLFEEDDQEDEEEEEEDDEFGVFDDDEDEEEDLF